MVPDGEEDIVALVVEEVVGDAAIGVSVGEVL